MFRSSKNGRNQLGHKHTRSISGTTNFQFHLGCYPQVSASQEWDHRSAQGVVKRYKNNQQFVWPRGKRSSKRE
ncbi:hypothetical protein JTE90_004781 [Oedothorax gibbosus]|uniref:Uncharacterized protein n=1 Tax=Oedothorax gibbosus TaxID=931172 RepID=A0AAV6VGK0_9ARAC|nr:hypothetical protein JTE90_004781 [Oedothorax gibbosus]